MQGAGESRIFKEILQDLLAVGKGVDIAAQFQQDGFDGSLVFVVEAEIPGQLMDAQVLERVFAPAVFSGGARAAGRIEQAEFEIGFHDALDNVVI